VIRYLLGQLAGHRFADKTLENFVWNEGNRHLREFFYEVVMKEGWEKGVGLVGEVGVGKTHLLSALYKNRVWVSVFVGGGVPVWFSFMDLVTEYRDNKRILKELLDTYDLVFVDDIWSVGASAEEKNIIRELVFRCYDGKKVLCYTANWSYERWDIDERVKDRMRETSIEIELVGSSFRGEGWSGF
jgi:DNA replication protein DnaC